MSEVNASDTTVGGASEEDTMTFQVFPDSVECFAKLSRHLPSIVVEPTDGEEVESGELRWPPDDVICDVTEGHQVSGSGVTVEEADPQEKVMGGV